MSASKPPLHPDATRDLAAFAAQLKFDDVPREAVERIKYCVLDSIGCCLFGVTLPWTRHVQAMVEEEGAQPVASIFGSGRKTSIPLAVLVNSTAGHAFEFDETIANVQEAVALFLEGQDPRPFGPPIR